MEVVDVEEELEELREQLVCAQAEAERLAEEAADREARTAELAQGMESLRRDLAAARGEAAEAKSAAATEARALTERYRAALIQSTPETPPELIQGESVEELDRSLTAAREIVARVRAQVETNAAARIPSGSPARGRPDHGALSPAEKIRAGVESVIRNPEGGR